MTERHPAVQVARDVMGVLWALVLVIPLTLLCVTIACIEDLWTMVEEVADR